MFAFQCKGIECLLKSQILKSLKLCKLIVQTFDISNLDYLIYHNSQFEISKINDIWLQRYKDQKFRDCVKDLIPLYENSDIFKNMIKKYLDPMLFLLFSIFLDMSSNLLFKSISDLNNIFTIETQKLSFMGHSMPNVSNFS